MSRVETALKIFDDGFYCSQSVVSAFCEDYGLRLEPGLKLSTLFGAGIVYTGETCGAVTGALIILGLKYGKAEVDDLKENSPAFKKAGEFIEKFKSRNGTIICKVLVGYDINDSEKRQKAREREIFKEVCPKLVQDTVEILEEIL
ncbi:C-GCAxxG-C-C family protein [candidate division KSB1 bacterium]